MKLKLLTASAIAITASLLFAGFLIVKKNDLAEIPEQRTLLIMREIGHMVLRYSGDTTSRVLPIERMNKAIFQIKFEKRFSFDPDTLVKIVDTSMKSGGLPMEYLVNVIDCTNHEIVYGYEIRKKKNDIVPCLGRKQPVGCYILQIAFADTDRGTAPSRSRWWIISISVSTFFVFVFTARYFRGRKAHLTPAAVAALPIGQYAFHVESRLLRWGKEDTELTDKESKLLRILASSLNQTIHRERLLKEVWEDEGVFVGRSLDVFVSRLRKKMQKDPNIRITNIHGKGYRLEVNTPK